MPVFFSRSEIKTILDEVRANWSQPYTKEQGQRVPVSQSETMDILISSLMDQFGISSDTHVQTATKGHARIYVPFNIVPAGIEPPNSGLVGLEGVLAENFQDKWHEYLRLPERYAVVGVFFDVIRNNWVIIVESDAIPLPSLGELLPVMEGTYQRTEDGRVHLTDFKLI